MGAFTVVELDPQSYLQPYPLDIFYLNRLVLEQTFASPYSFSQATPFWSTGVVLKRTEMFVLWQWDTTLALLGFIWPTECPLA